LNIKTLDIEELIQIPYVDMDNGYDISPDGFKVAFSWNKSGRWEIYEQSLKNSEEPKKISIGDGAKFNPRWSPDGNRLAYIMDINGGEAYGIKVYNFTNKRVISLTPNMPFEILPSYCWSPDGKQIAFAANQGGIFAVYMISSLGGYIKKVFSLTFPFWELEWSPDGRYLSIVSEARGQDYWIYIYDIQSGEYQIVSIDSEPICAKDASWSPDGHYLSFASNHLGYYNIAVYEIETKRVTWLTEGETSDEFPDWSPDGEQIVYIAGIGGKNHLAVIKLSNRSVVNYLVDEGVHYRPKYSPDEDTILCIFDNPKKTSDLWRLSSKQGDCHQITNSMPDYFDDSKLIVPEEIQYPSLDGALVPALLYKSSEREKQSPPAVIYIHGGPSWITQVTWDPNIQYMVNRGWTVLAPNYRGSTGYGRDWQWANQFDLGGVDTKDVVAGAEYLINEGLAHPKKIAVTGTSWGGYLTMTCLTQYPDRWAAGSAIVPFMNWFTSHPNSREDLRHWDIENFGTEEENHELWYARSPFFFLDKIQVPVQLICGENDVRCPASESAQAKNELLRLGKICDYHIYKDEGHSFLKIENLVDSKKKRVKFLEEYLEKE